MTGDDCIAIKGNSTNIVARNITCLDGVGLTIGSVAQYPDYPDYVENVLFEDCVVRNCMDGVYIKAWQGTHTDKTGNGDNGGGGGGYVRNVTWKNVLMDNVGIPIYVSSKRSRVSHARLMTEPDLAMYLRRRSICMRYFEGMQASWATPVSMDTHIMLTTSYTVANFEHHLREHTWNISICPCVLYPLRRTTTLSRNEVPQCLHSSSEFQPRSTYISMCQYRQPELNRLR